MKIYRPYIQEALQDCAPHPPEEPWKSRNTMKINAISTSLLASLGRGQKKPAAIKLLTAISFVLPGDWLKTFVFLNFIHRPRKLLRSMLFDFYRMDHIYDVIREFTRNYRGNFSIMEFGVAEGYSFIKTLYATRYLKCEDRITVHGFDSFAGMPKASGSCDRGLLTEDSWVEGQYQSDCATLSEYCAGRRYRNFVLHKGMFDKTITEEFLSQLRNAPPILVWIDCDYYTSARIVFERLLPALPNGCVIYFDEPYFNYGSRFTGEAKLIHEINTGLFGDGIELVPDAMSLNSNRIYRFINLGAQVTYAPQEQRNSAEARLLRNNGSPFP